MKNKLFLCLIVLLSACQKSEYEGYSVTKSGLDYKFEILGDGAFLPSKGDFVLPGIVVSDTADSVIWSNAMSRNELLIHKINESRNADLNEAFSMLYEGDSAVFIMDGSRVNLDKLCEREGLNGRIHPVKIAVKMNQILTPQAIDSLERLSEWLQDEEMNEQIILNNFLKENRINKEHLVDGIYYVPIREGDGPQASGGSTIRIHYKAFFTDGRIFDNTYEYTNALEIDLGKPDQLLEGFEIGIRQMKAGGRASFVIPSQLGFGERGSSTGIVPPFTSLIYDVELLSVRR